MEGPHHILDVAPGRRPRLVRVQPRDFWYAPPAPAPDFVRAAFDVVEVATPAAAWKEVGAPGPRTAFVGAAAEEAAEHGVAPAGREPEGARRAPRLGADVQERLGGRRAARRRRRRPRPRTARPRPRSARAPRRSRSTTPTSPPLGDVEDALPYTTIVGLDHHAATLHYHGKSGRETTKARVFLIDAGATARGYASDITRTYVAPGADPVFVRLLDGMKALQARLCATSRPGPVVRRPAPRDAPRRGRSPRRGRRSPGPGRRGVREGPHAPVPARTASATSSASRSTTSRAARSTGKARSRRRPRGHPALRTTRVIEERMVFTIEPGLYFIPMLLEPVPRGAARRGLRLGARGPPRPVGRHPDRGQHPRRRGREPQPDAGVPAGLTPDGTRDRVPGRLVRAFAGRRSFATSISRSRRARRSSSSDEAARARRRPSGW